ncbi:putative defensin-like protein 263 [Durio zibethinus]|uniref:Defensin-like protein 263 n=1 Tax=Durio zibethinus TaxID=66656 RepID=A0A6P6BFI1_DURZI|nr:putative defensin-like protein 263 [Durio zibethinus]
MASFGVASLLVMLLVASCVSNSVARECSRDIDCAFKCKHGGFCDLKTGKCSCLPASELASNVVPIVDAKCKNDADCAKACPPGCKIHNCLGGTCFCECSA